MLDIPKLQRLLAVATATAPDVPCPCGCGMHWSRDRAEKDLSKALLAVAPDLLDAAERAEKAEATVLQIAGCHIDWVWQAQRCQVAEREIDAWRKRAVEAESLNADRGKHVAEALCAEHVLRADAALARAEKAERERDAYRASMDLAVSRLVGVSAAVGGEWDSPEGLPEAVAKLRKDRDATCIWLLAALDGCDYCPACGAQIDDIAYATKHRDGCAIEPFAWLPSAQALGGKP